MGWNLSETGAQPVQDAPEKAELLAEIERLRLRVAMAEAERDEYAQQNAELFVLQQVFSTINSTLDINDILSMVLRGVTEALKFNRVVLFDVDEHGNVIRRLESDGNGNVVHAADAFDYLPNSTLQDVAQGITQVAFGNETDLDKPLSDTSGSYCIAPLVARDVVRVQRLHHLRCGAVELGLEHRLQQRMVGGADRVAALDAQRVQLHQFAPVVFIQPAGLPG